MNYDKRICTHKWGNNPTHDEYTDTKGVVISAGTYDRSLEFLNGAAAEAKKDFPGLKDSDIEPFIITKSGYNKNFAGIWFPLPENTEKAGYRQVTELDFVRS
jgi:hypothetical protein